MFLTNKTSFVNFVDTFPTGESKKITCRKAISLCKANIAFVFAGRRGVVPYGFTQKLAARKYNCR